MKKALAFVLVAMMMVSAIPNALAYESMVDDQHNVPTVTVEPWYPTDVESITTPRFELLRGNYYPGDNDYHDLFSSAYDTNIDHISEYTYTSYYFPTGSTSSSPGTVKINLKANSTGKPFDIKVTFFEKVIGGSSISSTSQTVSSGSGWTVTFSNVYAKYCFFKFELVNKPSSDTRVAAGSTVKVYLP